MKKFLVILLIVLGVGGFLTYKKFYTKEQIKILETAKATRGNINAVLVETGTIRPQVGAQVKISTRATGTIVEMSVKIGDEVKKGQIIARIDDRETIKAIEKAKSAYEYARVAFERQKQLLKADTTTKDDYDKAKDAMDQAESELKRQEIILSYYEVYAPMDGVVSDVTAQEGETIVAGLQAVPLITVIDPTRLELWIYVDETNIGDVKYGINVEYTVDTYPDKVFRGKIHKVYPQPEVRDNIVYYLGIVEVSKEDARWLKTGMTTRVKIIYDERRNILIVPNEALKFEGGKQVAYKVTRNNKVEKVEVQVGARGEENTEIISGLKEGDVIATKLILPLDTQSAFSK